MKKIFLSTLVLFALGCNDDLNTFFTLGEFRVLDLQLDTPEIDGTATTPTPVQVTPFISDVDAGGRNVELTIYACVDPGIDLGIDPICDPSASTTQSISYADVNTATLGSRFTGALPNFTVNVPQGLLAGQSDRVKFNGVNYLVTVDFTAGDDSIHVYKRIIVSERSTKNNNPQIENILLNGNASGDLSDQDELTATVTNGFEPESYDIRDDDGDTLTNQETYIVTWYSYKGTTDLTRIYLDEKAIFTLDPGESNPFVIAVLRDDRGGSSIQIHE